MSSAFAEEFDYDAIPSLQECFGETLLVRTGADSQEITGIVEMVDGVQEGTEGFELREQQADILFRQSELELAVEKGTTIEQTVAGKSVCWKVMSNGGNPPLEYADGGRTLARVRVKQWSEECVESD